MRLVLVLLVCSALAFAGCFGKKSDNTATDTTPTPGETTPTASASTPSSSTPTSSTPTDGNSSGGGSPAPMLAPKQACTGSADWTQAASSAPAGASAPPPTTCNIDAGYTHLILNVTWTVSGGAPGAPDPNGVSVAIGGATCALPGPVDQSPAPCTNKPGTATPGKMTITYSGGPAPIQAAVVVVETP
jgi:hypothetical protein